MNGSQIVSSIYYTTIKRNGAIASSKNRGSLLRHPPEDSASISSHYTPIYSLIKDTPLQL